MTDGRPTPPLWRRRPTLLIAALLVAAAGGLILARLRGGPVADYFATPGFLFLAAIIALTLAAALPRLVPRHAFLGRRSGTFLLHAGLLGLIIAATGSWLTGSRGFLQVVPGEYYSGNPVWVEEEHGPWAGPLRLPFTFQVTGAEADFWPDGSLKTLAAGLLTGKRKEKTTLRPALGRPARHQGIDILQTSHFGYAVTLVFRPRQGPGIPVTYLLDPAPSPLIPCRLADDFPLTPYHIRLQLTPNTTGTTPRLVNPRLKLTVSRENTDLFSGPLRPGSYAAIDGGRLYWYRVSYWNGLTFRRAPFSGLLAACLLTTAVGAALTYRQRLTR